MVEEFRRRRDVIVDGLREIPGFPCARPKGAFYVFPNITRTGFSSRALADRLVRGCQSRGAERPVGGPRRLARGNA